MVDINVKQKYPYADVFFNGVYLGHTENMFVRYEFFVQNSTENTIQLII
jgi:hypothetical protein